MRQGSRVHAHPLPTPPPQAGEGADRVYGSVSEPSGIPGPFVPAKAGTQILSHRLDSRLSGNERRGP
jgi:hypothetical protein